MIKNLVDAEKQRNKNTSTLVTQLIEILNICMFQLLKILHNQKKYLKKELKTIVEEIIAKENQQNSYRMFFWSEYVKMTMLCTMAVRCQQDLSCFWIGPSLFRLSPSHLFYWVIHPHYLVESSVFWLGPSHFLGRSFPFFSPTYRVLT